MLGPVTTLDRLPAGAIFCLVGDEKTRAQVVRSGWGHVVVKRKYLRRTEDLVTKIVEEKVISETTEWAPGTLVRAMTRETEG